MVMPALTELKNKTDKTDAEKNSLKLFRLLAEQPHIPLTDLQTIKCPTLVIGGDHDVIKEEHTMLIYKNIPQAYLWILPASGHSTPVVYKDDFNKIVDRFFSTPTEHLMGKEDFFNLLQTRIVFLFQPEGPAVFFFLSGNCSVVQFL